MHQQFLKAEHGMLVLLTLFCLAACFDFALNICPVTQRRQDAGRQVIWQASRCLPAVLEADCYWTCRSNICSARVFHGQKAVRRSVVMVAMSIAPCHEGGASGSTETARFFSATAKSTSVVVSSIVCSTQTGNNKCAALSSTLQAGRDWPSAWIAVFY